MRKIILGAFFLHALATGQSIQLLMSGSRPPAPTYLHYRTLTIDHTQVGGSTLSSFPVLVTLALGAGKIQNASCFDVVFATDNAGSSKIPWELDGCNQSTGAVTAWVQPSSISSSSDTVLYVVYDSAGVSSAQNTGSFSPATMWAAAGYLGVFHMGDGSTLSANDSTSNAYNGTLVNSPTATSGQIGGAALFTVGGSSQSITIPTAMSSYGTKTCSFWVRLTSLSAFATPLHLGSDGTVTTDGIQMLLAPSNVAAAFMIGSAGGRTSVISVGTWTHLVIEKTASLITNLYIDAVDTSSTSPSTISSYAGNIIGDDGGGSPLDGAVDEFRLRSGASTAGWITAEFNNQKTGSTFLTVGSEI